jgi:hypothetical protein
MLINVPAITTRDTSANTIRTTRPARSQRDPHAISFRPATLYVMIP